MEFCIHNDTLRVGADTLGAELSFITGTNGTDYLWPGQSTIWQDRAPNLFPYVARLTEGKYSYRGMFYPLPIHGFASRSQFTGELLSKTEMLFSLSSTAETLETYPFPFRFTVGYRLEENRLYLEYTVENAGSDLMHFGIGAHPGFRVPLESGLGFRDYFIEFPFSCQPQRIGFTEQCFLNGEDSPFPLQEGRFLPLSHSMFDNDAIVLRNMPRQATLRSLKGSKAVSVSFPDMPYLGIWHRPGTDAPYICIEPWKSLPSRQGIIEDLETQPTLETLSPHEQSHYTITITLS